MDPQAARRLPQTRRNLRQQTQDPEFPLLRSSLPYLVAGSTGGLGNDRMPGRWRSGDQHRGGRHFGMDQGPQREIHTLEDLHLRQANRGGICRRTCQ